MLTLSMSCRLKISPSYVMHSCSVRCCSSSGGAVTGHLTDFQYHTIHHHLFFTEFALCPVPQTLKPGHCETFSSNPLFYMFPPSLLASPLLLFFFFFHSLAQTALALTRGHPMLSLSNYLTNHSETALISAYCSA